MQAEREIMANYSRYSYEGSENFEHDDSGGLMNYSGMEDIVFNAISEHEGWAEGYDY